MHLSTTLASPELSSLLVPQIQVTANNSFIKLRSTDIPHTCQCFRMRVVFYEAEATWCPVNYCLTYDRNEWQGNDLVFRSNPMIILLIPPPSSGLAHFVKSSYICSSVV